MEEEIIEYLKQYLNLSDIKLENDFIKCLIISEAKKKQISYEEEEKYQIEYKKKDGMFCPIDLTLVNLILDIEKEFNIIINDFEVQYLNTIEDLIKNIESKIK